MPLGSFCQNPGIISLRRNVNRYAGLARNQERLIAKLLGRSGRIDARSLLAPAAIPARKPIDGKTAPRQSLG
jgi:hypothetical protein